jgi:starch phosphorylase
MWKNTVRSSWADVSIESVDVQTTAAGNGSPAEQILHQPQLEVGSYLEVTAKVRLGKLKPEDVAVEIYYGIMDSVGHINSGEVTEMEFVGQDGNPDVSQFKGSIPCKVSGQHGYSVRIRPKHEDMSEPYEPGLILWEK